MRFRFIWSANQEVIIASFNLRIILKLFPKGLKYEFLFYRLLKPSEPNNE